MEAKVNSKTRVENSTWVSSLKCVNKEGRGFDDLANLLQAVQWLILGKKLSTNLFEEPDVLDQTRAFQKILSKHGFPESIIEFTDDPEDPSSRARIEAATTRAADEAAKDLHALFTPKGGSGLHPYPPESLPQRHKEFFEIVESTDAGFLENIVNHAFDKWFGGSVRFMLAVSPELRRQIKILRSSTPKWTMETTDQLEGFLRCYQNIEIAADKGSPYAPAVARARQVRCFNYAAQELDRQFDEMLKTRMSIMLPAGIPALRFALVERSRGYPEGVIEAGRKLREKAEKLHPWIEENIANPKNQRYEDEATIRKRISEMRKLVSEELGLTPSPLRHAIDSFEVFASFDPNPSGFGPISTTLGSVYRLASAAWGYRARSQERAKLTVLTELSKTALEATNTNHFGALVARCSVARGRP